MAELITLTTPVFVSAGTTRFRVFSLQLRRQLDDLPDGYALIYATFLEVDVAGDFVRDGRTLEALYRGEEAETLIAALNKANLSTNSLEKRVTTQCQADGKLGAGVISGTA